MDDWDLKIEDVKDNVVNVKSGKEKVVIKFNITKKSVDTPNVEKTKELWFKESSKNQFKDFSAQKPIVFKIKNKDTKEITEFKFKNNVEYKISLKYGFYEISADVDGYDFKLEYLKDNLITIGDGNKEHENAVFIFTKNKVENNDSEVDKPEEPVQPTPDPVPPTPEPVPPTPEPVPAPDVNVPTTDVNTPNKQNPRVKKVVEDRTIYKNRNQKWGKISKNRWVFVDENGDQVRNAWIKDGKYWFRIDEKGILMENTIFDLGDNKFIATNGGYIPENGWKKVGNSWYYAKKGGYLAKDQWLKSDGEWYWFKGNAKMSSNEWKLYNGIWYYSTKDGSLAKDDWKKINGKWYHFNDEGELSVSTRVGKYYVNENGEWVR